MYPREKILKMEVYKLGKTIENQQIEIQNALHQLNEARDGLKWSLKRRREITIDKNETHYQENDTTGLFADGDTSEFDVAVSNLMENNASLTEEVINLKIE